MKKRLIIFLSVLLLITFFMFLYLNSRLKLEKKQKYVEYINSILPDISQGDIKQLTKREEVARISQCITTYLKACNNNDVGLVKDILNKEYVDNMDLNINSVINYDNRNINLSDINIDTVYKVNDNIFFCGIKDINQNICFIGIVLNEDKTRYSIFLDGIYNYNNVKKYEFEKEYEDFGEGQVEDTI